MNFYWLDVSHSLSDIHRRVKQINRKEEYIESHINEKRKEVLELIREVQKNMATNTFILNLFNVSNSSEVLRFCLGHKGFPTERSIDSFGYPKAKLDMFIQQLLRVLPHLAEKLNFSKLANLKLEKLLGVDHERVFFASTLPSLFGYCWCAELVNGYLDFLFTALLTNDTFKENYMVISLTNIVRLLSKVSYNREVFSEPILLLLNRSISEQECALAIVKNLSASINIMPAIIKQIIKRFSSEEEVRAWTPLMFIVNCVILPIMRHPKETGTIDARIPMTEEGYQRLSTAMKIIEDAVTATGEREIQCLLLDLMKVISEMGSENDMMSASFVLPLLNSRSFSLQLTLPSIGILIELARHSSLSMQLSGLAEQLVVPEKNPIVFYEFEFKDLSVYNISLTEETKQSMGDRNQEVFMESILALLLHAPIRVDAPQASLAKFIEFHKMCAETEGDNKLLLLIDDLTTKGKEMTDKQWSGTLPSLEDRLQQYEREIMFKTRTLMELATIHCDLSVFNEAEIYIRRMSEESRDAKLYGLFVSKNREIVDEFGNSIEKFKSSPQAFEAFFCKYMKTFAAFAQDNTDFLRALLSHHHCWLMSNIPFADYVKLNDEYQELDDLLFSATDKHIQMFCVEPACEKTRRLFTNAAFHDAIQMVTEVQRIASPLLAIEKLSNMVMQLNELFKLHYDTYAQADELSPLINYALMGSRLPRLYSYVKYLQKYTCELIEKGALYVSEQVLVGFTHVCNHVDSLAMFMKEKTE